MKIELEIDSLALPRVDPFTEYRFSTALEEELDRLVEMHGLPAGIQGGAIDLGRLALRVSPEASVAEMGVEIARQLYEGLGQQGSGRGTSKLESLAVDDRSIDDSRQASERGSVADQVRGGGSIIEHRAAARPGGRPLRSRGGEAKDLGRTGGE